MSDHTAAPLSVSIRELSPVHAACLTYLPPAEQADLYQEIHRCFQQVQEWVRGAGLNPASLLHVGVPVLREGRLARYECCIEVPAQVPWGPGAIGLRELPGGRTAVLSMEKDPSVIGRSIGRFYREVLPQNNLQVDGQRPTYEIYYETTMEYCVPVV